MRYESLNKKGQEDFLMPILIQLLQNLGGKATREELKDELRNSNFDIEDAIDEVRISRKNGKPWKPFDFVFNFSIANLEFSGFLTCPKRGELSLTDKGQECDVKKLHIEKDIRSIAELEWERRSKRNQEKRQSNHKNSVLDVDNDEEMEIEDDSIDTWKEKLKIALCKMEPKKFEMFCRALVRKMGVDIDENIGISVSNDGGLDGFGYVTADDFRTTRVAIQAKRWSQEQKISSPEIDKFRGAMDKFRAEFGIFITTASFSKGALLASREGTRAITLIDGNKLVELVAKYQVYVTPVITYQLDDFYR